MGICHFARPQFGPHLRIVLLDLFGEIEYLLSRIPFDFLGIAVGKKALEEFDEFIALAGREWDPVGRKRSLRHFRIVELGSDDLFQHMPARHKISWILELFVFEDTEDFGERRADRFSRGLRDLARCAERDGASKGDKK